MPKHTDFYVGYHTIGKVIDLPDLHCDEYDMKYA